VSEVRFVPLLLPICRRAERPKAQGRPQGGDRVAVACADGNARAGGISNSRADDDDDDDDDRVLRIAHLSQPFLSPRCDLALSSPLPPRERSKLPLCLDIPHVGRKDSRVMHANQGADSAQSPGLSDGRKVRPSLAGKKRRGIPSLQPLSLKCGTTHHHHSGCCCCCCCEPPPGANPCLSGPRSSPHR
jgi:hypothetical protein